MPTTKSAAKAMRASIRKRAHNLLIKNKVRSGLKSLRKLIADSKKADAKLKFAEIMSALDKAAKKKVFKKQTASRLKSRLAKAIEKIV